MRKPDDIKIINLTAKKHLPDISVITLKTRFPDRFLVPAFDIEHISGVIEKACGLVIIIRPPISTR